MAASNSKLLIFSAPSGSGKTTIVRNLLERISSLEFSISATSRRPRGEEVDGKDYYFLSPKEFENKISQQEFLEYEEVYKGSYYGTLKSEVDRIWNKGHQVIFDIDVIGGLNLKKQYGDQALAIFVQPPSIVELEKRLRGRGTETEDKIKQRLSKAETELSLARDFDEILINDDLKTAVNQAESWVKKFIAE